jgi:hypothetical protein
MYPYNYPYQQHPSCYPYFRQYPPVDPTIFSSSVTAFQKIANEASVILKKFGEPPFAHQLMTAAQKGDQNEVDRLMKSIGTGTPITTKFTPSGLLLTIHAKVQQTECCTLSMFLRWGN